jgi:hypothetical protein
MDAGSNMRGLAFEGRHTEQYSGNLLVNVFWRLLSGERVVTSLYWVLFFLFRFVFGKGRKPFFLVRHKVGNLARDLPKISPGAILGFFYLQYNNHSQSQFQTFLKNSW